MLRKFPPDSEARSHGYFAILKQQPALTVILLTVAGHMLMQGSVVPVLSLYSKSFGVSEWAIGLVVTIFGVGRLAADIPSGLLADKFGRRTLLWIGPTIACIASAGAALTDNYVLLLVFRFLQGVGSGIYMTVATIVVADSSTTQTRGAVVSLYQTAMIAGWGLGPLAGGLIAERYGLAAPFWLSAAIALLAAAFAAFVFKETRKPAYEHHSGDHGLGAIMTVVSVAPLAALLALNFASFFTRSASQWTMLPLLAHTRFGLAPADIGLILTMSTVANFVALPVAGATMDRFGRAPVIVAASLVTAISLFVIVFSSDVRVFWAAMAATGLASGFGSPAIVAYSVDHAPGGRYGPTTGVMRFAGDLGFVIGPVLVGSAVDLLSVGYGGAIAINATLVGATALGFAVVAARAASRRSQHLPAKDKSAD